MIIWNGMDLIVLGVFAVLMAACGVLELLAWGIRKFRRKP